MLRNVKLKIKENTKYEIQYDTIQRMHYNYKWTRLLSRHRLKKKVNITVCFLKSKWPDWGDSLYKNVKFCNYLGELYCTALFMFYNDKR